MSGKIPFVLKWDCSLTFHSNPGENFMNNDANSLTHDVELQISHSIRTEVQEESMLWAKTGRDSGNPMFVA